MNRVFKSIFLSLCLMGMYPNESATGANELGFALCGTACDRPPYLPFGTQYYIGYHRTNLAVLGRTISPLSKQPYRIYRQVADLTKIESTPNLNEQKVDLENGSYVSSTHRIDDVRVGFMRKSELMHVHETRLASQAQASVRLVWGDTLTVMSKTLPRGTPVTLQLRRSMGGFGAPVTDFAHYFVKSQTLLNRKPIAQLDYTLLKKPGSKNYLEVGQFQAMTPVMTYVGDVIRIESSMLVNDGVRSHSTPQVLNGADSVAHNIEVVTANVELRSASRTFPISSKMGGSRTQQKRNR